MENAIGRFERASVDNYEEFLVEALGLSTFMAKCAVGLTPIMEVTREDETWTIKTTTTIKSIALKFKLGEPFDETSPDGRDVSSIVTQDGNKFVCIQTAKKEGEKSTKSTREFTGDECIVTMEIVGADPPVVCKQVFKRV